MADLDGVDTRHVRSRPAGQRASLDTVHFERPVYAFGATSMQLVGKLPFRGHEPISKVRERLHALYGFRNVALYKLNAMFPRGVPLYTDQDHVLCVKIWRLPTDAIGIGAQS